MRLPHPNYLNAAGIVPFNSHNGIILHQILNSNAWQSNFTLLVGDRINYTLRYELNAGFPNVRFAAGVARRGQQGVMNFSEHVVLLYPQTSSRTINVTFTRGGDVFGIQPGGGNSAVNYYQ